MGFLLFPRHSLLRTLFTMPTVHALERAVAAIDARDDHHDLGFWHWTNNKHFFKLRGRKQGRQAGTAQAREGRGRGSTKHTRGSLHFEDERRHDQGDLLVFLLFFLLPSQGRKGREGKGQNKGKETRQKGLKGCIFWFPGSGGNFAPRMPCPNVPSSPFSPTLIISFGVSFAAKSSSCLSLSHSI